MSRSISIGYRTTSDGSATDIDIRNPYDLFGTHKESMEFWSLPIWDELGVTQLAKLGHTDPIYFIGWDMMDVLAKEIRIFQDNITRIDFDSDAKATWLAHLVYCYSLLVICTFREGAIGLFVCESVEDGLIWN